MHEHERLSADIGKAIEHTEINQIIQTSKVPSDYSDFQGSIRLFRLPRFHQIIQTSKVPSDYSDFQGSANTCIWVRVVPHRTPKNS